MLFVDKNVIVSGGGGELGSAVVRRLLLDGANFIVPCMTAEHNFKEPVSAKLTVIPNCDLTEESHCNLLYQGTYPLWASIHLAGGFETGPCSETSKAQALKMFEINFVTALLCTSAAIKHFGPAGGRIVNVASRLGIEPALAKDACAYAVSKAAVAALTASSGAELRARGILVNAVAPDIIDTAANRAAMSGGNRSNWTSADELAKTICFLASPENSVSTGMVLKSYG